MLLLGLAFRNALRNVQRTMFTAGTVVLGTALLVIALTWEEGVFGGIIKMATAVTGHVRVVNPQYAAREDLLPIYENLPDVDPVLEKVRAVPGVKAAFPRILNGCTLTAGEEIGDVFGLAVGAPQEWYTDWLDVDSMVTEGRFLDPENTDEVVLGQGLADRTGAKVGTEIVMLGQTQDGALSPLKGTVVGIVHGGNALVDQQVDLSFSQMQYMADMDGGATEILIYGADKDEAKELRDVVQQAVPELTVQAWSQRDPWAGILGVASFIQGIVSCRPGPGTHPFRCGVPVRRRGAVDRRARRARRRRSRLDRGVHAGSLGGAARGQPRAEPHGAALLPDVRRSHASHRHRLLRARAGDGGSR
jgi:ABC-type lipoprotein release transport system permease subunit